MGHTFSLSRPAKEALKTGLSMSIACGLAMGFGWAQPIWACLAVAVVSMPTVGESINKSIHRLLGTALGAGIALLIICLFSQNRWAFIISLTLWMGFVAYRITVSRYVYVWFISGYVSLLIAAYVTSSAQNIFYVAVLRVQETALGILVYTIVSVFIWPQKSSVDLDRLFIRLLEAQQRAVEQYFAQMLAPGDKPLSENLYGLEAQFIALWRRNLDATETERFEVFESRGWWRQLIAQSEELMEALELWRESLTDMRQGDVAAILPDMAKFRMSIAKRLHQIALLMTEGAAQLPPRIGLTIDLKKLKALSHRQQAAVYNTLHILRRIERLTDAIGTSTRMLRLPRNERVVRAPKIPRAVTRLPDADSAAAAIRIMTGLMLSALIWICFDVPGHISFIVFEGVHSLIGLTSPQMNWAKFFFVQSRGIVIAGLLYVFVLPQLSGYFELSVVLFALTASLYYVFWDQKMTMLKMSSLMPFLLLANIQLHPTYNFATFANNITGMQFSVLIAALASGIPFCQRPEKMFLRTVTRYFRQTSKLAATFAQQHVQHKSNLQQRKLMVIKMRGAATKAGGWINGVNSEIPGHQSNAAALVANLNTITCRCKMLVDSGRQRHVLWEHCAEQANAWETAIAEVLMPWAQCRYDSAAIAAMRNRLAKLEADMETTLAILPEEISNDAYVASSRLLGSYRGLYRSLISYAEQAVSFDWNWCKESRF